MSDIPLTPLDITDPADIVAAIRKRRGGTLLNLDRLLLNSPPLAESWNIFLGTIREKLSVSPRLREIAICTVAVINEAEYEFHHHSTELLKAGGSQQQVDALRDIRRSSSLQGFFDERENLVIMLSMEMTEHVAVQRSTMDRARQEFSTQELVDLIATIATYNMVSRVIVACNIRPEN